MIELTLYTTQDCHLCQQALELLTEVSNQEITVNSIDISVSKTLTERYGQTIPVVRFPDSSELSWPFSLQDIETRLSHTIIALKPGSVI